MSAHVVLERLRDTDLVTRTGRVRQISPTWIEADGPSAPIGALCAIETRTATGERAPPMTAEVVAIQAGAVVLAPLDAPAATFSGARVVAHAVPDRVGVGDGFLGRAIDAMGRPIDGEGAIRVDQRAPLSDGAIAPLLRATPRRVLETGVRAIDGLLTLGQGQRVGVFAASGVGKTRLVLDLAGQVEADRCVVCLVGERGREVETFWSHGLSARAKARTTLVAATADQTAAMRARAVNQALALATHWREQGHHVLFLLDSVTRLAMALREIGLAAGEPPTVRAYTPSVFAGIPKVVERCGALKSGGAITAIMTVLSETDDNDDPIAEMMKALLDGHIVLSRGLAEQGHFPAIDTPRSISRLADSLRTAAHQASAETAGQWLGAYEASRTLIEAGVYVAGSNPEIDRCLERRPALLRFLRQRSGERSDFSATREALAAAVADGV